MTLVEYLEQKGLVLKNKGYHDEYSCPCPWCGGKDRFTVWEKTDRYYCRQCERKGDFIQFLMDYDGNSYTDACRFLSKPISTKFLPRVTPTATVVDRIKPIKVPGQKWQQKACAVVAMAEQSLWKNSVALNLLRGRGLNDATIKAYRLGYMARTEYQPKVDWGLPVKPDNDKVALPAGILIPYWHQGQLIRLRVRLNSPRGSQRYHFVADSSSAMGSYGQGKIAVFVVENDLDAMLIAQEAGDLVKCVGALSAANRPDVETYNLLKNSQVILALDNDDAGRNAINIFWKKFFPHALEFLPTRAKDPGEIFRNGESIRAWIQFILRYFSLMPFP